MTNPTPGSVHDPDHPAMRWRSVSALLDAQARATPGAPAVAFPVGGLTYAELTGASVLAARRLANAGVARGDRVGILLREASPAYLATALGALRLGAMVVPVNARNRARELGHVMRHSGMGVLFSSADFGEVLEESDVPPGCRVVVEGEEAFEVGAGAVAEEDVAAAEAAVTPGDHAMLLYTSGTTADPKGCLHPHATMLAEGENCAQRLGLTAADRIWTPLPLFHVGGWQAFLLAVSRGGCLSHVGAFEAGVALDQLEQERATVAFPAFELIWLAVLDHPRFATADLGALRVVINVGVPERLREMQERVPQATQVSVFGMTESFGSICMGSPDDPLESRLHTSGRPLPGIEVRVLDPATGSRVDAGGTGELIFRGVTRFSGYFRDPDATALAVDDEGFYHSGDLVRLEEDGSIAFVGRAKDMLKVGGENVAAAEVEGWLITHPAIAMAAVVGARDARYGEVPAAFVQVAPGHELTEQDLVDHCAGQIATYKIPRYVRFVTDYPTTPTQKIQKFVLRERINEELDRLGIDTAPRIDASARSR